jgi:Domain of unknown function (DUF4189)
VGLLRQGRPDKIASIVAALFNVLLVTLTEAIMYRHRCLALAATVLGVLLIADIANAQYLPTPGPDLTLDGQGNNIGCVRAGYSNCGGLNSGNARPAPPKPDVWGAIAMSPGAVAWGASWNFQTESAASADAIKRCRASKVGGDACRIVRTVADVCLALVFSASEKVAVVSTPGPAVNFSEDNGKLLCRRAGGRACQVLESFCADGQRHEIKGSTVFTPSGNPIFLPDGQSVPGRTTRR